MTLLLALLAAAIAGHLVESFLSALHSRPPRPKIRLKGRGWKVTPSAFYPGGVSVENDVRLQRAAWDGDQRNAQGFRVYNTTDTDNYLRAQGEWYARAMQAKGLGS